MMKLNSIMAALFCSLLLPVAASAQSTEPEKLVTTANGCSLYASDEPGAKTEWSGSCVDGLADGFGTQTTRDKNRTFIWTGVMRLGKSEGEGYAISKSGGKVEGTVEGIWENNYLISGTMRFENGTIYTGEFQKDYAHGFGSLLLPDGSSYVGNFKKNQFSGRGVFTYSKGGSYDGEWLFDKKHGFGIERGSDGQVRVAGYWANGVYSRPANSGVSEIRTPNSQTKEAFSAPVRGCAENGSCYGDISSVNGQAKTIKVEGYYRSDGTYVRGHYRSKGNK